MAGNWSPERIFLEYFEAEMTEIGRIPEAQMKLRILIKKTRCSQVAFMKQGVPCQNRIIQSSHTSCQI